MLKHSSLLLLLLLAPYEAFTNQHSQTQESNYNTDVTCMLGAGSQYAGSQ